ncbi:helix-turn-helix domain-containing protein [Klebsiella pneumoniae]|nr:helix-turn-helix domain-containing protein [Klebsiella pneumoniae]ELU1428811.1 helix-turn-helix domain-containing protein [Raoultella planticola]MBF7861977.1 helix-turn-helix domain-containing protein [Klebsiella quasipneumoniae]DAN03372.1 MAG TPA: helix-turn-helix domain protein [Caudoviricetes sp.]EIW8629051.1 helix-turn-helix domain-containing protein [Klebsiella pneumoniae]
MSKKSRNMVFANRLQRILKDLGWSQSEMARRIGVTAQSVQSWCGGVTPRKDKLDKLAEVTGRPVHWFFMSGDGNLESEPSITEVSSKVVTPQEQVLLQLFNELPESERTSLIQTLKEKKQHYDQLLKELLEVKNKKNVG